GSFQMLIEPVTAEGRLAKLSLLAQTGNNVGATELTKVGVDQADLVDYETQIRVLKSPTILNPVVEKLQKHYPALNRPGLLSDLTISRISYVKDGREVGTKILDVHYHHEDPEKIKLVLEVLSETYLQYSLQERLSSLRQGVEFIDEQLPPLQQRVDTFQRQLQQLREQYDLSFPIQAAEDLSDETRILQAERIDTQARLAEARESYVNLEREIAAGNPISILSRNPNNNYNVLINQLQQIEGQIAIQSSQFKDDSPPMQVLFEKRDNLRALLAEEAEAARRTLAVDIKDLEARARYIEDKQAQLDQRLDIFPDVLRRYADLERKVGVATDTLKTFLEKREALKLDASQREIPWELISPPDLWKTTEGEILESSGVNKKRLAAIAVILSTLVGIGVGLIVEILHAVYHRPEEVKGSTKLPLLGAIPAAPKLKKYEKQLRKHAAGDRDRFLPQPEYSVAFLEAFRTLYANIALLGAKSTPIRSIVISSPSSGDGKSTIAWHLAQTAAHIGQRVLLVDADLRCPQLHWRLGLSNSQGLSDLLQSDLSLNEVIQQAPSEPNLFVLSGGQIPYDPIKLLSSAKMEHLMEQFQGFFDLAIYDTPPLVGLADANLLAAKADGIVVTVRLEKTNRGLVAKAIEGLKMARSSILGVVANEVKPEDAPIEASYLRGSRARAPFTKPVPHSALAAPPNPPQPPWGK
ncbi:MAG: polysaccharide biosynthesis tyrosine autokinase, partial [Cyanobacteriota bacterium]|nr:polysaccharide biosynthesis tyrosine autokinase [Cyanobacteriota bacterium]